MGSNPEEITFFAITPESTSKVKRKKVNDHQQKKLFVVRQILFISTLENL